MKPGSKGWMHFMKKIYCFSEGLLILSLVAKFLLWHVPELKSPFLVSITNVCLMTGVFNLAIMHVLAMFEPIHQKPNWAAVYPELRGEKPRKRSHKASRI
jgi:hypothetical protein